MSRQRYDDAFGVVRMRWEKGHPSTGKLGPVVVEVWRPDVSIQFEEDRKPQVLVQASQEIWIRVGNAWMRMGYAGQLSEAKDGEVRRHAYLTSRTWRSTIALDGWRR